MSTRALGDMVFCHVRCVRWEIGGNDKMGCIKSYGAENEEQGCRTQIDDIQSIERLALSVYSREETMSSSEHGERLAVE